MAYQKINGVGKMDALEIEDELIEAIEATGHDGLSYKVAADVVGMEYNRFYQAAQNLIRMGKLKLGWSYRGHRLILPDWHDPAVYTITVRQRAALEHLISLMDENHMVRVSMRKITAATGSGFDTVTRLDYKGYLEVVERGGPTRAALYRVYPNRDGPLGYSYI